MTGSWVEWSFSAERGGLVFFRMGGAGFAACAVCAGGMSWRADRRVAVKKAEEAEVRKGEPFVRLGVRC